ncbi:MAG TPA: hypothetical protein VFF31_30450 [Blastocatellia bacterium]|jgi:hypothetical protein|nr:hypothetical protein [Blastocatellia bacterium]
MSEEKTPSSYEYVVLRDRRPLCFLNGAKLAVILTINIESWERTGPGASTGSGSESGA